MQLTIFAKKRTKEDRTFYNYLSHIVRTSTGEEIPIQVKFPEEIRPKPADCPMNIIVEKENANLSTRNYEKDGVSKVAYSLWVSKWEPGEPYEDHSLDDFD